MGVFMRDPQTGRKCKKGQKGIWYYYFTIKAVDIERPFPEAQNKESSSGGRGQRKKGRL
ncbi:MAG: hypothetical protein IPM55_10365 [Acidobacteria bacterium]|nr:hypothetical protein [Acidobacteriota bacterium]